MSLKALRAPADSVSGAALAVARVVPAHALGIYPSLPQQLAGSR